MNQEVIPPGEENLPAQSTPVGWIEMLQADTPNDEIHKRAALTRSGQPVMKDGQPLMLDFVTARFVQDRLDTAVGPMNWQTMFESLPSGAVRCGIGIRDPNTPDAGFIWKWDVGVPSNIEPDKGAHSDAFKRAGVQWGIARDLYDTRDEDRLHEPGQQTQQVAAAPQGTIREQVGQPVQQMQQAPGLQPVQAGSQIVEYDERTMQQAQPAPGGWVCPVHQSNKVVPAGISKRSGKPYDAFLACDVPGCDQKQPFPTR